MTASLRSWRRAWRRLAQPPQSLADRNARLLYIDTAWWGIVNGISGTFTSVFAVRLGASTQLVGLIVSLPALVMIFCQLAAARLVQREPHRVRLVTRALFLNRLGYLAIALMPFFFAGARPQALVAVVGLMAIPATVGNLSFSNMLADVVPSERRAHVVSTRFLLVYLTTTVTVLLTGRLLDHFAFPGNYQGAFLVAFVASLLSVAAVARVRIPGDGAPPPGASGKPMPWRATLADPRFRGFLLMSFAVNVAVFAPAALYTPYRVRILNASDTWIGLLGTTETGVAIFASYLWGRYAARRGSRQLLLLSMLGLTAYPVLTVLSPRIEPLLFVAIIGGFCSPAYNISIFNLLLGACPQEGRPAYMALYNVLLNVATFAAPLASTYVADWFSIPTALLSTSALRLGVAAALAWWAYRERRPAGALQPRMP